MQRTIVIWVIDDAAENHGLVERSLPDGWRSVARLDAFLRAENALAVAEAALRAGDDGALPDVVFMDYFIASMTGDDATSALVALYREHGRDADRPFIVGHSSVTAASAAIVRAGGDIVIAKPKGALVSREIGELIPDVAALSRLRRVGRPAR